MLFTPIKGCSLNANHKQTIKDIIKNKPVSSRLFKVVWTEKRDGIPVLRGKQSKFIFLQEE